MTLIDAAGRPIGDLPPKPRTVNIDLDAIAQRSGIARGHPLESQRTAAKNLLIDDVDTLLVIVKTQARQLDGLVQRHGALIQNSNNANVLLALILRDRPEWRWSKADVEEFEPTGGWVLEPDPADPEGWLLRMALPDPIVSADEPTEQEGPVEVAG